MSVVEIAAAREGEECQYSWLGTRQRKPKRLCVLANYRECVYAGEPLHPDAMVTMSGCQEIQRIAGKDGISCRIYDRLLSSEGQTLGQRTRLRLRLVEPTGSRTSRDEGSCEKIAA